MSAVDVALSAKPGKVLKTVDAGLDMLSTCDANALKKAVVTTEKATAQAISANELIPDDATIDEVVDAAASVDTTWPPKLHRIYTIFTIHQIHTEFTPFSL